MKAFVIKNKEGKYRGNSYIGDVRDIRHAEIYDTKEEILLDDNEETVEITITEGDLEQQLAEKDKEINKLKEPKKYAYNCLSFVSNSNTTDVAKYIEDLHQTIAQNNEELDEYVEKIVKLKEKMEEKDKEIEQLKKNMEFDTAYHIKELVNVRKQVCDEIRNAIDNKDYELWGDNNRILSISTDDFNEILDQIEKGE